LKILKYGIKLNKNIFIYILYKYGVKKNKYIIIPYIKKINTFG